MCGCAGGKRVLASWFCCGDVWGPCCLYFDETLTPPRCVPCPNGTCPQGKNCNDARCRGACGNCQSYNNQCAWPNISDACKNLTQPQNCNENPSRYGCGTAITVTICGPLKSVTATIADCGPRTKDFCGQSKLCCYDPSRPPYFFYAGNRLIDLTPAAFSAIATLDSGIVPVGLDKW
ncbi:MAG TPA: RlpA-like double-psi beta-barrel domain-containing protein [Methylomirabilota bacterium]|jgi:hypothetical protein|nr:RlpA-like double-psi beta-barrel domain-containing protein [Methylomirabilota bacterium]